MSYVVVRVATNAEGGVAPSVVGSYEDYLVAQTNFYTTVADAASKVNAGRKADGVYLLTSIGEYLDSKFFTSTTE